MRLIRPIFVLVCALLAGLVVWGGVYTRKQGFTASWRETIEAEFERRGYYVDIGKLTLGAFRGLVAEDVRFFLDPERREEIAFVDDVFLDLDFGRILEKRLSINTLDVQDANLSLPLEPGNPRTGAKLRVRGLSGRIVVTESLIQIVKAEADVAGVAVSVRGNLIRPPNEVAGKRDSGEENRPTGGRLDERRQQARVLLSQLQSLEFPGEPPRVTIEFRGDLRDLSTTTATATIESDQVRREGRPYEVQSISGLVSFDGRSQQLEFRDFDITDGEGNLNGDASWDLDRRRIGFRIDSTADVPAMIDLYVRNNRFKEIVFFQAPRITAEGELRLDEGSGEKGEGTAVTDRGEEEDARLFSLPGRIIGEIQTERFVSRGAVFNSLDFGFHVEGERFYVRNLRLDHKTGVAFLNAKYEPGSVDRTFQYQTEIKLDPRVFRPFFDEGGRRFLDAWGLDDQSTVYLAAAGQGPSLLPGTWRNRGAIDVRNFRLNGVEFLQMESELETDRHFFWFRNVRMTREDGEIVAEMAQNDTATKLWEVKGVRSTTNLVEGARAFSPPLASRLTQYRLSGPPTIRLHGTIDGRRDDEVGDSPRRNDLQLSFTAPGTTSYEFLGQTLPLDQAGGEVRVTGPRIHLTSFRAGLFGGEFEVEYDAKDVRSPAKPWDATLIARGIPVDSLTRLYGGYDAAKGKFGATFHLSGNSGGMSSVNGHGTATIREGDIFALPVFGALSRIVAKRNGEEADGSRKGNHIAREASATFSMRNGILGSDDIEAFTDRFVVHGAGEVNCMTQEVAFDAVVNVRKGPGKVLMTPVSELLTFTCEGTLREPVWKAKTLSQLTELPGALVRELGGESVKGLQEVGRKLLGERDEDGAEAEAAPGGDAEGSGAKGKGRRKAGETLEGIGRQLFQRGEPAANQ